jgi:5-methylcytosine-specific restriction endonuclease McrA
MRKLLDCPIIVRSGLYCEYCGVDLLSHPRLFESFVLDHLQPRSRGGRNGADNLRVACAACDRIKRDAPTQTVDEARVMLATFRIGITRWFEKYRGQLRGEVMKTA